jgi:hypothetical protein
MADALQTLGDRWTDTQEYAEALGLLAVALWCKVLLAVCGNQTRFHA